MNSLITNNTINKQALFKSDINMAKRFLTLISECDEPEFAFQVFSDKKDEVVQAQIFCGSFEKYEEKLLHLNQAGSGVFVTINRTDGKGRKTENIIGVRAVFVDLDGSPLQPVLDAPLSPHIVIESSPGRYHAYWILQGLDRKDFSLVQKKLIERFDSDPQVHDLARVMRLPGFIHQKGSPFLSKIIQESGEQPFAVERFLDAFGIVLSSLQKAENQSNSVLELLNRRQMIINKQNHPAGSWTIRCPWEDSHSKKDLGTKYFEPNTNGYSGHGFKCFHQHCESRTSEDFLQYLGIGKEIYEPLPLHRDLEAPRPFPFKALGGVLEQAAHAFQSVIKAPDAICAQSVLAAAALATQAHANVIVDGREIPLSIFFITIAESGDRKSGTDKFALKAISDYQKMLADCYRVESKRFQLQKECWEMRKKEWFKSNQEDKNALFDEPQPVAPLRPLLLVEEPTYEGIVKYFDSDGQPSIGLFSDEGGRFFGGHAMKQENCLKTISGLSSLWDGKPITRMRFGDGEMLMYGRRLCMHLMVQEVVMSQLMENDLYDMQGFLPRCLVAFPPSTAGNRAYVEEDLSKNAEVNSYWDALNSILDKPFPVDPPPALKNELKPRSLMLSLEAKKCWIAFHDAIDADLVEGKRFYMIRRFAAKAPEHVLRLSGVLTLVENPDACEINIECIRRGIQLMNYYLEERLRIQGYISINPKLTCAASLLKWFWKEEYSQIPLAKIYQYGPQALGIRTADRARSIMSILVEHGWAIPISNTQIDGKKHKEAWLIKQPQQ